MRQRTLCSGSSATRKRWKWVSSSARSFATLWGIYKGGGAGGSVGTSMNCVSVCAVPVGGAVDLQVQYLHDAASTVAAVLLRCALAQGTFPEFAWFLNDTLLGEKGASHLMTHRNRTLLLVPVIAENSGYYHCEAKDSFDDTPWVRSQEHLIHGSGKAVLPFLLTSLLHSPRTFPSDTNSFPICLVINPHL